MDDTTHYPLVSRVKGIFCTLTGISGPVSKIVYQTPWWKPAYARIEIHELAVLLAIRRFLFVQKKFHFFGMGTAFLALVYGFTLDKDTILTITAALVGLSAITFALIAALTTRARGYADWLWLALRDSGIKISLSLNVALIYFAACRGDQQSLAWAFPVWIQLLRSVFISSRVFELDYDMTSRAAEFAQEYFKLHYASYSSDLFVLRNPYIRAIRGFSLRLELSYLDQLVGIKSDREIQMIMTPTDDGLRMSVRLVSKELQDALDRINNSLRERFERRPWMDSPPSLMQRHARWFSENAADAAKDHRWEIFEGMLHAYASVTGEVCNTLRDVESKANETSGGPLINETTYTWNAPTEAFEYAIAFAPRPQAQKTCVLLGTMLHSMNSTVQSVQDYIELLFLPSVRSLLFKRGIGDLPSIERTLSDNVQDALLAYLKNPLFIKEFFLRGEVIIQIIESVRFLQTSFVGNELTARQAIGIEIIRHLVAVGGFTNNGIIPAETRDTIRNEILELLKREKWDTLKGQTSATGIVLSEDTMMSLRRCLEQVNAWT